MSNTITIANEFNTLNYVSTLSPQDLETYRGICRLKCTVSKDSAGTISYFRINGKKPNGNNKDMFSLNDDGTRSTTYINNKIEVDTNGNSELYAVFFESDFDELSSVQFSIYKEIQSVDGTTSTIVVTSGSELQIKDILSNTLVFPVTGKDITLKDQKDGDGVIVDTLQGLQKSTLHVLELTCYVAEQTKTEDTEHFESYDWTTLTQQTFTTTLMSDAYGELIFKLGNQQDYIDMYDHDYDQAQIEDIEKTYMWEEIPTGNMSIVNQSMIEKVAQELNVDVDNVGATVSITAINNIGSDKTRVESNREDISIEHPLDCPEHVLVDIEQLHQIDVVDGKAHLQVRLTGDQLKTDENNVARAANNAYNLVYHIKVSGLIPLGGNGMFGGRNYDFWVDGSLNNFIIEIPVEHADMQLALVFRAGIKDNNGENHLCVDHVFPSNRVEGKITSDLSGSALTISQNPNGITPKVDGSNDTINITFAIPNLTQADFFNRLDFEIDDSSVILTSNSYVDNVTDTEELRKYKYTYKTDQVINDYFKVQENTTSNFHTFTATFRQVVAHKYLRPVLVGNLAAFNTLEIKIYNDVTDNDETFADKPGLKTTFYISELDRKNNTDNYAYRNVNNTINDIAIGFMYQTYGSVVQASNDITTHINSAIRVSLTEDSNRLSLLHAWYLYDPQINKVNDVFNNVSFTITSKNDTSLLEYITLNVEAVSDDSTGDRDTQISPSININKNYIDDYRPDLRVWNKTSYTARQTIPGNVSRVESEMPPTYTHLAPYEIEIYNMVQSGKDIKNTEGFDDIKECDMYCRRHFLNNVDNEFEEDVVDFTQSIAGIKSQIYTTTIDPSDSNYKLYTKASGDKFLNDGQIIPDTTQNSFKTTTSVIDTVLQAAFKLQIVDETLTKFHTLISGEKVKTGNGYHVYWCKPSKGLFTTAVTGKTYTNMGSDGYAVTSSIQYDINVPYYSDIFVDVNTSMDYGDTVEQGYDINITYETAHTPSVTQNGLITPTVSVIEDYSGETKTKTTLEYNIKDKDQYFEIGQFTRTSEAIVVREPGSVERLNKHVIVNQDASDPTKGMTWNTDTFEVTNTDLNNNDIIYDIKYIDTIQQDSDRVNLKNGFVSNKENIDELDIVYETLSNGAFKVAENSNDGNLVRIYELSRSCELEVRLSYDDNTEDGKSVPHRVSKPKYKSNTYEGPENFIIIDPNSDMNVLAISNGNVSFEQALLSNGSSIRANQDTTLTYRSRMSRVGSEDNLSTLETSINTDSAYMTWRDFNNTVQRYFTTTTINFEVMPTTSTDGNTNIKYYDIEGKPLFMEFRGGTGNKSQTFTQDPDPKIIKIEISDSTASTQNMPVKKVKFTIEPGYNGPASTNYDNVEQKVTSTTSVITLDLQAHLGTYQATGTNISDNLKTWLTYITSDATTINDILNNYPPIQREFELDNVVVYENKLKIFTALIAGPGAGYEFVTFELDAVNGILDRAALALNNRSKKLLDRSDAIQF